MRVRRQKKRALPALDHGADEKLWLLEGEESCRSKVMSKKATIPKTTKGPDRNYLSVAEGGGMSAIGRKRYNAATGSNLKAPAPHPKTEADAARKKSFCARSQGWTGERGKAARKRWAC